jgi:hypothetical protein
MEKSMKIRFKLLVLIAAAVLLTGIAVARTVDVSGEWLLTTGWDPEVGIIRLTTSASGFQGVYTAGLEEDGYHCDIKDGKVSKSRKVSFTFVCGSDEIEARLTGRIAKDGNTIEGSVNNGDGKKYYFTMTRTK